MPDYVTLEKALTLVSFRHMDGFGWQVRDVFGTLYGHVHGDVWGDVKGNVRGTINGRRWESVETPKEKLQRLLDGASEEELLKLINHIENN